MWDPKPLQWAVIWPAALVVLGTRVLSAATTWPAERVIPSWLVLTALIGWQLWGRFQRNV